jgi:hypothetical protein
MRTLTRSLLKGLEWLPGIGYGIRVVNLLHTIRRLEEERRWGDARTVRCAALQEVAFARSAPLWRSEGEDLLQNRREPRAALEAFQKAEQAMGLSPALFGVTAPDRVYAGAACAALAMGQIETARAYRGKLADLMTELARRSPPATLPWHRDTLAQLDARLFGTARPGE